jgi:hypothetical protein
MGGYLLWMYIQDIDVFARGASTPWPSPFVLIMALLCLAGSALLSLAYFSPPTVVLTRHTIKLRTPFKNVNIALKHIHKVTVHKNYGTTYLHVHYDRDYPIRFVTFPNFSTKEQRDLFYHLKLKLEN